MGNFYRIAATGTVVSLLAGCAGSVTIADNSVAVTVQSAQVRLNNCTAVAYSDPRFEPLWNKLPMNVRQVSMDELTNEMLATDPEIELLAVYSSKVRLCRNEYLEQLRAVAPKLAALMAAAYEEIQVSLVDLMKKERSWGDYIKSAITTYQQLSPKLAVEMRKIGEGEQAQNSVPSWR